LASHTDWFIIGKARCQTCVGLHVQLVTDSIDGIDIAGGGGCTSVARVDGGKPALRI